MERRNDGLNSGCQATLNRRRDRKQLKELGPWGLATCWWLHRIISSIRKAKVGDNPPHIIPKLLDTSLGHVVSLC